MAGPTDRTDTASNAEDGGALITFDPLAETDLSFPAEMVAQMATGLEEPVDVARRFGYEGSRWARLSTWRPFLDAVQQRQQQLQESGWTFRTKAALGAELLLADIQRIGLSSHVPVMQKLAIFESLAKHGDLVPKQVKAETQAGAGFTVNIHLPAPTSPVVVDVAPAAQEIE